MRSFSSNRTAQRIIDADPNIRDQRVLTREGKAALQRIRDCAVGLEQALRAYEDASQWGNIGWMGAEREIARTWAVLAWSEISANRRGWFERF